MTKALLLAPALAAVVALTAFGGCSVEVNDGDFSDGSVGVGTGGFVPPCSTQPLTVHAQIERNDEILRIDAGDAKGGPAADPVEAVGVYEATANGFTVDACGVSPCAEADLYEVIVDLAGSALAVPDGAFVEVAYTTSADGFALVVTNLDEIDGVTNPVDPQEHLWFQLMRGLKAPAPLSASFALAATCQDTPASVGGAALQGHDVVVSVTGSPQLSTPARVGVPQPWVIPTTDLAGSYSVLDIASFALGETPLSAVYVTWKGPVK